MWLHWPHCPLQNLRLGMPRALETCQGVGGGRAGQHGRWSCPVGTGAAVVRSCHDGCHALQVMRCMSGWVSAGMIWKQLLVLIDRD